MKFTIIGAGAIGGTTGAFLARAGHDVTVVDVVREHVDAINRDGLRISGIRGDKRYPLKAIHAGDLAGPLENVILAVKGHFTESVVRQQVAPLLSDDGVILSLQNGLNEETIASIVGPERVLGAFVHFGADYLEPGHIVLGQEQTTYLGELDGTITPRLRAWREALSAVMPTEMTDNLFGFLWGKLVYGSMAFAVSTIDAPVPEVLDDPRGMNVAMAASAETAALANRLGYRMESIGRFDPNQFLPGPDLNRRARSAMEEFREEMRASIKQYMGIWRDLRIKRRKTEVDVQCGVVVERARELGMPVPVNQAIVRVIHEIESGDRSMGWDNLDDLASVAR
jgi:2-dehydropantoate 2-reductase